MDKFKVGDVVKITKNCCGGWPVGTVGVIGVIKEEGWEDIVVFNKAKDDYWFHCDDCMELHYNDSYPELEGKLVEYRFSSTSSELVQVRGCDYHVGITITAIDDVNYHYICYHGPLSPQVKKPSHPFDIKRWEVKFKMVVDMILSGVVDLETIAEMEHSGVISTSTTRQVTCPFIS